MASFFGQNAERIPLRNLLQVSSSYSSYLSAIGALGVLHGISERRDLAERQRLESALSLLSVTQNLTQLYQAQRDTYFQLGNLMRTVRVGERNVEQHLTRLSEKANLSIQPTGLLFAMNAAQEGGELRRERLEEELRKITGNNQLTLNEQQFETLRRGYQELRGAVERNIQEFVGRNERREGETFENFSKRIAPYCAPSLLTSRDPFALSRAATSLVSGFELQLFALRGRAMAQRGAAVLDREVARDLEKASLEVLNRVNRLSLLERQSALASSTSHSFTVLTQGSPYSLDFWSNPVASLSGAEGSPREESPPIKIGRQFSLSEWYRQHL